MKKKDLEKYYNKMMKKIIKDSFWIESLDLDSSGYTKVVELKTILKHSNKFVEKYNIKNGVKTKAKQVETHRLNREQK